MFALCGSRRNGGWRGLTFPLALKKIAHFGWQGRVEIQARFFPTTLVLGAAHAQSETLRFALALYGSKSCDVGRVALSRVPIKGSLRLGRQDHLELETLGFLASE